MKGFDKLNVKSAVKSHNKFNLSRTHLTTSDFGQISPLFCEETVPGDKFNVNASYFSRMAPLVKPTYGKFSFRTMAGFVPYYQLADDFEAFVSGKQFWEGDTPIIRKISFYDLMSFFVNYCSTAGTSTNYSFCYTAGNGTLTYKIFTNKGRYWVKVLNSLGYSIPESADFQVSSNWYSVNTNTYVSMMPILAFFKLYNDWMSQSQRYNSSALTSILRQVKHNVAISGKYATTGICSASLLRDMFDCLLLQYDNDYFTSAWQQPTTPLGVGSGDNINTVAVPQGLAGTGAFLQDLGEDTFLYNPAIQTQGSSTIHTQIGQRMLDTLKDFDDWVRRNNYSGSRTVQQVYSRFGIKTSDFRDNYAEVISTDISPIQVGDVTSQSDATGAVLGDYAGKGILSDGKSFSYEARDYGMLFVFGWFTVTPMNPFGFFRHTLRTMPLQFYTPEFDGLGADEIEYREFYEDPSIASGDSSKSNNVYGFTERYNSYRFGRDMVTGDFRDFKQVGMNVWHTARYLRDIRANNQLVAQASAVNSMSAYDSEYNRIFNVTSGSVDHFYLTCNFDVTAVRPMLSLNQVPRLGEGSVGVPRNGNVIK